MLLEVANSLAFAFVLSEKVLRKDASQGTNILTARPLWALLVANILLSPTVANATALLSVTVGEGMHALAAAMHAAAGMILLPIVIIVGALGPHIAYTLEFAAASALLGLGMQARRGGTPDRKLLVAGVIAASGLFYCCVTWWTGGVVPAGGDSGVVAHHPEAVRVCVAMLAFSLALFYDIKRFEPEITLPAFLQHVATAALYVVPLIPCIAVAISTLFFLLVSLLEWCVALVLLF